MKAPNEKRIFESNRTKLGQHIETIDDSDVVGSGNFHNQSASIRVLESSELQKLRVENNRVDRISPISTIQSPESLKPTYNNDGQQVFGEIIECRTQNVILSIHPEYSDKILKGEKTVELRRRFPDSMPSETKIFIYSTSPINAIVGYTIIENVKKYPVKQIWEKFQSRASIIKSKFDEYFEGLESGYVIEVKSPSKFEKNIPLQYLRNRFEFTPPQSFVYASNKLVRFLEDGNRSS